MTIHERIPRWLEWAGVSTSGAAEALGISRQAVQQWIDGDTTPTLNNLERLATEVLCVSLHEFWGPVPRNSRGAA